MTGVCIGKKSGINWLKKNAESVSGKQPLFCHIYLKGGILKTSIQTNLPPVAAECKAEADLSYVTLKLLYLSFQGQKKDYFVLQSVTSIGHKQRCSSLKIPSTKNIFSLCLRPIKCQTLTTLTYLCANFVTAEVFSYFSTEEEDFCAVPSI